MWKQTVLSVLCLHIVAVITNELHYFRIWGDADTWHVSPLVESWRPAARFPAHNMQMSVRGI